MNWKITIENCKIYLSLYLAQAEKVKAYFQRGARPFVGITE